MKICTAQTKSGRGEIQSNIENHKRLIAVAASVQTDIIIFPELSLTGYEPTLAKALAMNMDDRRLDEFQKISDDRTMTIGVGVPTKTDALANISLVVFQPRQPRQRYSKKYLHSDEEAFFASGKGNLGLLGFEKNMALAICYELSVPDHAEDAHKRGAKIYFASAAKTVAGVEGARARLSEIARKYSMTVCLANCVGEFDGCESGGKSSVFSDQGVLLGQLDDKNEGLLIFDTESHEVITKTIKPESSRS